MAILVTGGAGFIGSHITDKLIEKGYNVVIIDNLSTGNISNINSKAKFYKLDISKDNLEKVFEENIIDAVIHQAAQASVPVSTKDPVKDMKTNIEGTLNLLLLSRQYKIKKFLAASSAALYGPPDYLPVDEAHDVKPLSFYAISKHTMESYIKQFGLNYIITRYANVYGPRQDCLGEAGVVAIFIDKLAENLPVEIHGNGNQTRDFIFVGDIVNANIKLLESSVVNETVNISTNTSTSINELFFKIKELSGSTSNKSNTEKREADIEHSRLDNTKMLNLTDVNDFISMNDGLLQTIQWNSARKSKIFS